MGIATLCLNGKPLAILPPKIKLGSFSKVAPQIFKVAILTFQLFPLYFYFLKVL